MKSQASEKRHHNLVGIALIALGLVIAYAFNDSIETGGVLLMALGGLFMISKMH